MLGLKKVVNDNRILYIWSNIEVTIYDTRKILIIIVFCLIDIFIWVFKGILIVIFLEFWGFVVFVYI